MSRHDPTLAMRHMLDHARKASDFLGAMTLAELAADERTRLALIRLIEVVGEASNRVSPDAQARYPAIPWRKIAGMRNRLIHGYDAIDVPLLYDTIRKDLPPLMEELTRVLGGK